MSLKQNDIYNESVKEYMAEIGAKGGKSTKAKHGKEHYQKLAEHMNKVRKQKKENSPSSSIATETTKYPPD